MDDREEKADADPRYNTFEQCAASQTLKSKFKMKTCKQVLPAKYERKLFSGRLPTEVICLGQRIRATPWQLT